MWVLFIMSDFYYSLYYYSKVFFVFRKCFFIVLYFKDKEYEIKLYVRFVNIFYRFAQYV